MEKPNIKVSYGQLDNPKATLRDQFAMAAMQGILASCHGPAWGKDVFPIGESAYAYADLMMEARGK